jgi:hypothetical protein
MSDELKKTPPEAVNPIPWGGTELLKGGSGYSLKEVIIGLAEIVAVSVILLLCVLIWRLC